jgi:hypothetical protein
LLSLYWLLNYLGENPLVGSRQAKPNFDRLLN